jgi:integrase
VESRRKKRTYTIRKRYFEEFCRFSDQGSQPFGDLRIRELVPYHVERFCDFMKTPRWNPHKKAMTRWTAGSVVCFVNSLHAALNWATGPKQMLITRNPIKGVEKPGRRSRGAAFLVPPGTHQKALGAARPDFRQLLIVLENTGCRPGELFMAEARHFDPSLGALIFRGQAHLEEGEQGHKTSGKDKDRIIILTGDALELVKQLVVKCPTGKLFRTGKQQGCSGNQPWNGESTYKRIRTIRKKTGLPRTFTLYSYRHQYATAWLKAGGSIDDLAILLGNTPDVIRQSYSHLCDDRERLRKLAEAFRQKLTAQEPLAFASSINEAR